MAAVERDFNRIIGLILRLGVSIAFAVIALGAALMFAEGQTGYGPLVSSDQLSANRFVLDVTSLFQGVVSGRPFAIIDLGLIMLFATPLVRVFVSTFLFAEEKRYIFVTITVIVFVILLLSIFVVGPLLSSTT